MKTILFPTDFSDNASNALRYAIPFAQRMNARLILLHVYPFPAVYAEAPMAIMDRETSLLRTASLQQLQSLVEEIGEQAPTVNCEILAAQGPIASQILTVSEEKEADWIIMGTQGKSSIEKVIFGSVTAQVMTQANCPVLGIPASEFFHGIQRIVYATDYQEGDLESLKNLSQLARLFDSEIVVLHVATEDTPEEGPHFAAYTESIRQALDYPKLTFHLLKHPNVQEGLEEFIERCGVDLLTMCSKKRGLFGQLFHGSQTKKMVYHTKKPLLALHY